MQSIPLCTAFVGVLHKILRELALVLPTLPGDRVLDEFFLQEHVVSVSDPGTAVKEDVEYITTVQA